MNTFLKGISMKLYKLNLLLIVFGLFIATTIQAATLEDFSRDSQYLNVKISPDGKHYAVLLNENGKRRLAFLDSKTFQVTYTLDSNFIDQAGNYYWVNNERVVIEMQQKRGFFEGNLHTGELFGVNYDGSKRKMLFGHRSTGGIVVSTYFGFVVDMLKGDDKHILIRKSASSKYAMSQPEIVKLNVYNGKEKPVKRAPIDSGNFLIDNNGKPRFFSGVDDNYNTKLFYLNDTKEEWQEFDLNIQGNFYPIAFAEDNNSVFALKSINGEPQGLYKYDLKTQEEVFLYRNEYVDPTQIMLSGANNIYGLRIDEHYPEYIYLDKTSNKARLHRSLTQAFKGYKISITSFTTDESKAIIVASNDKNSGTFYLFDLNTMKTQLLLHKKPWIKPTEMSPTEAFQIDTPDGLTLTGYLTIPKGKSTNLPTIILPHGGPHARDYWGYDSDTQMFANAGYAVIKINFRGSDGFGKNFMEAGYGQWGNKIQDDILLAANYAIQQKIADKDRICIYGGSFGGYSALQSAIRFPDTYKCAIGYVGVYDLPMMYKEGDIKEVKWGDNYLDKTLGTDQKKLIEQSPVHNIDKLKAAVFIVHGKDDNRAHYEHALALRDALDNANHPYEWLAKDKEGHGFSSEKNRLELYQKILKFVDKHIGH